MTTSSKRRYIIIVYKEIDVQPRRKDNIKLIKVILTHIKKISLDTMTLVKKEYRERVRKTLKEMIK